MIGEEAPAAEWSDLERELDAWAATGRTATFWWRDDDAIAATPALDRLLELGHGLPLALAVIPGSAEDSIARRLMAAPNVAVLQHGWMHRNHAPAGERAAELGAHRPVDVVLEELGAGWHRLEALLGRLLLPILTPPWNRAADALIPRLRAAGYCGLSASGPRRRREASPGLVQVNAHVDLVDWRARRFVGTAKAIRRAIEHLAARRVGSADPAEPTGILTHHLVMDAPSEGFLLRFLALTRTHPAARWIGAAEAFAAP